MTDTTKPAEAQQIAAGLTERQRDCVLSASETIGGCMQVWSSHRSTIKSIWKKGLCSEPNWRDTAIEKPLGLAVREIIRSENHDR